METEEVARMDGLRISKAITRERGRDAINFFALHTAAAAVVVVAMKPLSRYLPAAIRRIVAARRRGLYGFFFYDRRPVRSSNR